MAAGGAGSSGSASCSNSPEPSSWLAFVVVVGAVIAVAGGLLLWHNDQLPLFAKSSSMRGTRGEAPQKKDQQSYKSFVASANAYKATRKVQGGGAKATKAAKTAKTHKAEAGNLVVKRGESPFFSKCSSSLRLPHWRSCSISQWLYS